MEFKVKKFLAVIGEDSETGEPILSDTVYDTIDSVYYRELHVLEVVELTGSLWMPNKECGAV